MDGVGQKSPSIYTFHHRLHGIMFQLTDSTFFVEAFQGSLTVDLHTEYIQNNTYITTAT